MEPTSQVICQYLTEKYLRLDSCTYGRQGQLLEEAKQKALIDVWRLNERGKIKNLGHAEATFHTYKHRRHQDIQRQDKAFSSIDAVSESCLASEEELSGVEAEELLELVAAAISRRDRIDQEIYYLKEQVDPPTVNELAEYFGFSKDAVRKRLRGIRQELIRIVFDWKNEK